MYSHDFDLAGAGGLSVDGLAAHLGAIVFDFQREMKHAETDRFECRRHLSLATVFAARRV